MRIAYADPPYFGCAAKHYSDHPEHAVYDTVEGHRSLIESLMEYDGWAYSLSSVSIPQLAPIMPPGARWAAWTKPFCSFKPGVNPGYTWEPVVFYGGRKHTREDFTVRDYCAVGIALKRGFVGAKPDGFVRWVLDLLNVESGDEFVDVFPGSGAVTAAYLRWLNARPLDFGASA